MKIQQLELDKLKPYKRNARKIPEKAIAKVAQSIQEFGFNVPIVVDKDFVIIAGHTRLLAAQRLEMKTVPVFVAAGLSPAKAKAYRLADNRVAEETEFDFELLAAELEDLKDEGIDLASCGFDAAEIVELVGAKTPPPDEPKDPKIKEKLCPHCGMEL